MSILVNICIYIYIYIYTYLSYVGDIALVSQEVEHA